MNAKLLALTALAASMALVSCNKENGAPDLGSPKSVTINLANVVPATRAAGTPIADNTQVALTDFQVLFTDGTHLYQGHDVDGEPADHYFANLEEFQASERDQVFHFLPAEVNQVIVVGNIGREIEVEDGVTTLASIVETLNIGEQQDAYDLYLYGEDDLTSASGTDDAGHPLYKADVTLSPRVSRIEVASFTYNVSASDGTRKYQSITVNQIMLNNYYPQANSQTGAVSGTLVRPAVDVNEHTAFGLMNDAAADWSNDKFVSGETLAPEVLDAAGSYTSSYSADRPVYHFFPNASDVATTNCPQLIVNLVANDGTNEIPFYLATKGFNPDVTTDFAKIYTVSFAFDDVDLSDPEKCVEVSVSVASWDVVAVTPEF